jgi:hypothetical protein
MRLFFAGLLMAVLAAGCDGSTAAKGRVVGPDKKPIPGAKVRLEEHRTDTRPPLARETTTDASGGFEVGVVHSPQKKSFTLTVSKDGYKPHSEVVNSRDPYEAREIVLAPAAP